MRRLVTGALVGVLAWSAPPSDKRQALREILEMTDPHVILSKSGWYPGMDLK